MPRRSSAPKSSDGGGSTGSRTERETRAEEAGARGRRAKDDGTGGAQADYSSKTGAKRAASKGISSSKSVASRRKSQERKAPEAAGPDRTSHAGDRSTQAGRAAAKNKNKRKTIKRLAGRSPAGKRSDPSVAGYDPLAPERVAAILKRLEETYPAHTALVHRTAWELLVATILSAQSRDALVNKVTPALFERYPTVQAFTRADPEEVEGYIRSVNYHGAKSRFLVSAAKRVVEVYGGEVPRTVEELITLPGVARKTANVVLGSWFGVAEGVVVDTHVRRISRRLELTDHESPVKIEQDLMRIVPRDRWIQYSHEVIYHGRALCLARRPRCQPCPLQDLCHAADKTWSMVPIHPDAKP